MHAADAKSNGEGRGWGGRSCQCNPLMNPFCHRDHNFLPLHATLPCIHYQTVTNKQEKTCKIKNLRIRFPRRGYAHSSRGIRVVESTSELPTAASRIYKASRAPTERGRKKSRRTFPFTDHSQTDVNEKVMNILRDWTFRRHAFEGIQTVVRQDVF